MTESLELVEVEATTEPEEMGEYEVDEDWMTEPAEVVVL